MEAGRKSALRPGGDALFSGLPDNGGGARAGGRGEAGASPGWAVGGVGVRGAGWWFRKAGGGAAGLGFIPGVLSAYGAQGAAASGVSGCAGGSGIEAGGISFVPWRTAGE